MTLGELLDVCKGVDVRLHSAYDGRMVTRTNRERLGKYSSVRLISVMASIDAVGDYARTFLFVYGDAADIQQVKDGAKGRARE